MTCPSPSPSHPHHTASLVLAPFDTSTDLFLIRSASDIIAVPSLFFIFIPFFFNCPFLFYNRPLPCHVPQLRNLPTTKRLHVVHTIKYLQYPRPAVQQLVCSLNATIAAAITYLLRISTAKAASQCPRSDSIQSSIFPSPLPFLNLSFTISSSYSAIACISTRFLLSSNFSVESPVIRYEL